MACECSIVGLLQSNIPGVFSASINGSTAVDVAEDSGLILIGQTLSTLDIGAYAYTPGQDPFLGATCRFEASAQIPWITKFDCITGKTYFIPKSGAKASLTNRAASNVNSNIISMSCSPGLESTSFSADATNGPATPYFLATREDGFNLKYTGTPIAVNTGIPELYTIDLGFTNVIKGFLQSFSLVVDPPNVAKVQYSFAFSGLVI